MQHKTYDPCALLRPTPASHRILVVLNAPIEDHDLLEQAFEACSIRICADGGANRVHDFLRAKSTISSAGKPRDESGMEDVERLLPTHIHGDLDSLRGDVRKFYTNLGVAVTQDPDQYSTDFGKAMKKGAEALISNKYNTNTHTNTNGTQYLKTGLDEDDTNNTNSATEGTGDVEILILGSLSGRVDHAIGLLHEMLREQRAETSTFVKAYSSLISSSSSSSQQTQRQQIPHPTLTLYSPSSISFLLSPTSINTIIHNPSQIGPTVGILPVYGAASISTKGLEWDVEDWETRMGDMVSTSNRFAEDVEECVIEVKKSEKFGGEDAEGNWVVFTVERRMGRGEGGCEDEGEEEEDLMS